MQPLISIVLPAYNHEKYVQYSLESILQQDYQNIELHIIDDGSSDQTPAIIERWIRDNRVEFNISYVHRDNRGICATLNELYGKCNGSYICGLSSDDILTPQSISTRVSYLAAHPNLFGVCTDFTVIDDQGHTLYGSGLRSLFNRSPEIYSDTAKLRRDILRNFSFAGPVLMMTRTGLQVLGELDENLRIEDWDTYLRLSKDNRLGFVNFPSARYRVHGLNSHKNQIKDKKQSRYTRAVLEKVLHDFEGDDQKYVMKMILKHRRKEMDFMIRSFFKSLFRF